MKMSRDSSGSTLWKSQLERRDAAADADLEPAVAQMVEHADLLDEAQRRVERQQIDQRPEVDAAASAARSRRDRRREPAPC